MDWTRVTRARAPRTLQAPPDAASGPATGMAANLKTSQTHQGALADLVGPCWACAAAVCRAQACASVQGLAGRALGLRREDPAPRAICADVRAVPGKELEEHCSSKSAHKRAGSAHLAQRKPMVVTVASHAVW